MKNIVFLLLISRKARGKPKKTRRINEVQYRVWRRVFLWKEGKSDLNQSFKKKLWWSFLMRKFRMGKKHRKEEPSKKLPRRKINRKIVRNETLFFLINKPRFFPWRWSRRFCRQDRYENEDQTRIGLSFGGGVEGKDFAWNSKDNSITKNMEVEVKCYKEEIRRQRETLPHLEVDMGMGKNSSKNIYGWSYRKIDTIIIQGIGSMVLFWMQVLMCRYLIITKLPTDKNNNLKKSLHVRLVYLNPHNFKICIWICKRYGLEDGNLLINRNDKI